MYVHVRTCTYMYRYHHPCSVLGAQAYAPYLLNFRTYLNLVIIHIRCWGPNSMSLTKSLAPMGGLKMKSFPILLKMIFHDLGGRIGSPRCFWEPFSVGPNAPALGGWTCHVPKIVQFRLQNPSKSRKMMDFDQKRFVTIHIWTPDESRFEPCFDPT